ncbi:MAG TPA: glycosyltransferase family 39 protein [Anaerolineae bacterium]|nr:glycosyltransferase family 39 protein [Anaerolineae bacterium]
MTQALPKASERSPRTWTLLRYSFFLSLLLIAALAAYLRLHNLLPLERGVQFLQDYDEAVYDTTAQLMLQGHLPYRDFFATVPPVGIYLKAGVLRLVNVPWGSGAGFVATRYASVVYGLVTVVAVYLVARRLAGRPAGLVAAGLLAVDGLVIGMDRRATLETPVNLFSILAVLAYLLAFERTHDDAKGQRLVVLAGFLSALAALAKSSGPVVVVTLLTVSLMRRRLREAAIIAVSFGLSWMALCAHFLLQCPGDFVRQVYFLQLLRPVDGIVSRAVRLSGIWNYAQAWLTVRTGLVGALLLGLLVIRRRDARPWLVVLVWMGYTLALITGHWAYWAQYYVQLAVPLSLLGGGLLDARIRPDWRCSRAASSSRRVTLGALALLVMLVAGWATGAIAHQCADMTRMLAQVSPVYTEIAAYLRQNAGPDDPILVFEPNYTFLASRPPAGEEPGRFFVDSYGGMLYTNLGIQERPLLVLVGDMLAGTRGDLQRTFWRAPAQEQVLAAFDRAEYVIVDGRARYQLAPQTLATIKARSTEVWAAGFASVRRRR